MIHFTKAAGLGALSLLLAGHAAAASAPQADIVRTRYGIPHITATDYAGLGFGSAWAVAEDNVCLLADQIVTVSGERSKYFGAGGVTTVSFAEVKNLDSDIYFKAMLDGPALSHAVLKASPAYRETVRGYVAGYNAYLRKTGIAHLPAACQGAPWVRPISVEDLLKIMEEKMTQAGGGAWLASVVNAAPPQAKLKVPAMLAPTPASPRAEALEEPDVGLGSNGWAFGKDATGGPGVLLGNPHFPWLTTNRFYQIHLTLPGKLDVMGATLSGIPGVSIGFNKDVAWTHTVSTDRHFTLFELALDPADPAAYLVDGKRREMDRRTITVQLKDGAPVTRTLYSTVYGPVIARPLVGLNWTRAHAYALKDSNRLNVRAGDTWLSIARAKSVGEIKATISGTLGIPWVNTIAADRAGSVLYADITATPDLSAAKLSSCLPATPGMGMLATRRLYVLDGARSACDWTVETSSPVPGLMPATAMPATVRTDFVANSNDSYWLSNDTAPLKGFSPIVGLTDEAQSLRTRSGLVVIHEQMAKAGRPAITPDVVRGLIFDDRVHAAEVFLDDILAACGGQTSAVAADGKAVDISQACGVLAKWDRRMGVDSVGAALFLEAWRIIGRNEALFATPFDPADPVRTPRGLKRAATVTAAVNRAVADAVVLMGQRGVAVNAPWGTVEVAVRGAAHIPLHGGPGNEDGVLNAQQSNWIPGVGYVPFHGSSYIQVVTFDAKGPVAKGILSYSQSTDPASAHYADQTWLYSRKEWNSLPFSPAAIRAQQASTEHVGG